MICPKCGKTIEDNALYCEHCGEDIKYVPEFELDIDFAADILAREVMQSKEEEEAKLRNEILLKKKKRTFFLIGISSVLLLCIFLVAGFVIYMNSYDYQIAKANSALSNDKYEEAISYLEKAYELHEEDTFLLFDLGEAYYRANKMDEFVLVMNQVISESDSESEYIIKAYNKLITYYDSTLDYLAIEKLLSSCEVDEVLLNNRRYIALPPEFSYPEGTYESMVPLKLSSNTAGKIYYTIDGTTPKIDDEYLFTAPLYLESGMHTVNAIFVNEYGLKSDMVSKVYHIQLAVPSAPEVFVDSGDYSKPTMIEILEFDDVTIYYTVDGTFPSDHSMMYKGPIPMPLGKSTFRFVGYNEDGIAGEITERNYNLILNTDYTTDTACYDIIKKMMDNGKISDTIGTAVGLNGWYKYQFQYPITIEGYGDFYVIVELFQDITGNREKTGTYYGVNIKDRMIYKLSKDELGNYLLEGF